MTSSIRIEFSEPMAVYHPRGTVTGTVILNLDEPLKARALKICIDGKAYTHWTVSERKNMGNTTTRRAESYSGTKVYCNAEHVAWNPPDGNNKGFLPEGEHTFPFAFRLPEQCAPSFEGLFGYIRYLIKVELDRPWKFNKTSKKLFTVLPDFDLNGVAVACLPVVNSKSKETGIMLFRHGRLSIECRLPKRGYVPGETVTFHVDVDNSTSKPIVKAEVKMIEISSYAAYRHGRPNEQEGDLFFGKLGYKNRRKQERKVVTEDVELSIPPKTRETLQFCLPIPATVPSFSDCPIINVEYSLEVKVYAKGTIKNTITCQLPLIVGTIPVRPKGTCHKRSTTLMPIIPDGQCSPGGLTVHSNQMTSSYSDEAISYQESACGPSATTANGDMDDTESFAPRYPFYNNWMEINDEDDGDQLEDQ